MGRPLAVWLAMLAAAFVNGAIREAWLIPSLGERTGRAISTLMLCALVLLLAWSTMPWIAPRSNSEAWIIGAAWAAMTLAFEFGAGHYLFGKPWPELAADYDVTRGRIWILVLITIVVAPRLAEALRHHG
jgi:hypothetical protein